MKSKLIKRESTDMILIDTDGEIIYDDIGNYRYFSLGMNSAKGKNVRELFLDMEEDYPLLLAARDGVTSENFEWELTTRRNIQFKKVGSAYPLYDGDKIVGAVEFASFFYSKDHIGEIEQHSDHILYRRNHTKYLLDDIITVDPGMEQIKTNINQIALSDSNVLIYGETGTGKELIAQSIHNCSRRYSKNFVSQNCGAIPANLLEAMLFGTTKGTFTGASEQPGLFELVDGGTIFLDEINSLEPDLQVKLLKTIESKKIRRIGSEKEIKMDFRVVAATNEDPFELLRQGRIKPDLFYRLAVVYIRLPKLIERENDIELLTNYFIDYFNLKTERRIQHPGAQIREIFQNYTWPGNVRELRNVVEGFFAFAESNQLSPEDIPAYIRENVQNCRKKACRPQNLTADLAQLEREIICTVYENNGRDLAAAADILGISKQLLRFKLNKYESECI